MKISKLTLEIAKQYRELITKTTMAIATYEENGGMTSVELKTV